MMNYAEKMKINISEAESALTTKPLKATSIERFLILDEIKSQYKELPQPLRFSKFLSILLERVSVPLEPYDLIAGRCIDRSLTESEEVNFQAFIRHPDFPSKNVMFSSGHCTYSWEMVATEGLPGMRQKVIDNLEGCEDSDKKIFLTAILEIYDAIERYMLRYALVAEQSGLHELAQNLRDATGRPSSFASALQLLWTITFIDCAYITMNPTLTVGRLDQILYPFYCADIESGRLTKQRAAEYITDYYCKHNLIMGRGEHQVGDGSNSTSFFRILNFDAPQYLLLAGTDESGKPAVNELTELFSECIQPKFKNPVIVVRYFKDMDKKYPKLWKTLIEKSLASSSMMYYNDDNVISTFKRMGLPDKDSRKYAHFGCNWCSSGDNSAWIQIGPQSRNFNAYESEEEKARICIPYMRANSEHAWPEDFMIVLKTLSEREESSVTIEDFYTLFFEKMSDLIDRKLKHASEEVAVRRRRPSALLTFGDCFLTDSLRTGECFAASAKYHFGFQSFYMFGTVADCFIAVDQLVMIEKKLTLKKLLEAVQANFVGYEDVLALCRNADKYGMDTPLSNAHAKRLSETASELVIEKNKPYIKEEGLFLTPCMQSDTWHLKMGETFGATPNGRLANTPFSQNSRPSNGACVNGMTAMFNSMLNLPSDGLLSGALNLDVDKKEFGTEKGEELFGTLLASYFNQGGLHAQVSASTLEDLMDAQVHPQEHRDLRVRVTGYSGVFVDCCKRLQDDIIERFK